MWGKKKIVIVEEPMEADQVYDILCKMFPKDCDLTVFYMASRGKKYYSRDHRSLYVEVKNSEAELKVMGKSFKEIMRKLASTGGGLFTDTQQQQLLDLAK